MMRFTFLTMAPAVMANHLKGPMQDQLDACTAANCPDSKVFFEAANFDGTGMSFNTFVGPNNAKWISDVDYVLKVIGNNQVPYDYVASAGGDAQTNTASADHSAKFTCLLRHCMAETEPIWQPVGRSGAHAKEQPF